MKGPIKTAISEGQRYFDQPVFVEVSKARTSALAVNALFQRPCVVRGRRVPPNPAIVPVIEQIDHYERTPLRWVTPNGNGGFVPKQA